MSDVGSKDAARTGATGGADRSAQRSFAAAESSVAGTSSASTIGELGEFPLIELLTARTGASRGDTVVGAGLDDTAVTRLSDGRLQLATIDTLVAGTHFLLDRFTPEQVGRKAAAINLSDIAAMGGSATHALAAMAAPPDLQTGVALGIVEGLVAELAAWGAELVGGNLARHDGLVVDVALLGETDDRRLLLRSGARPGDALAVTGDLGAAAAGLVLLLAERGPRDRAAEIADDDRAAVVSRQRTPRPRLDVAPLLGPAGASAAIDVSDGLAADAGHICDRSGVGVAIDVGRLPVAESTRAVAAALGLDATELALGGGEDYELLFAAAPERLAELIARVEGATGVPVTVIGRVTAEPERVAVLPDGSEHELAGGWRHFGD